ncbi:MULTISPECIES: ferrochelatase [unclassified Nitratiruptor]|uniref:ferrochelatase n=1 Tax=unclassified Nitratiruptor TaxID=2624044 RepID=UPI001916BC2D|nr:MULTISPECIES: ferrochelatase [unclassified Nitratiruptor]BCD60540.1 protoporphyrin/coproporphyrin ferrochelatase [Nitratiruptor sp. YY08-10]BCD63971.1 protoporphyrin/coproporphyrin ferrochelatase [Nitratiruptor sp. YY08-14]
MKAIVLLNMGGPNNLDEVELFLKNMFNDQNILPIRNDLLRKFVAYMITQSRKKEAKSNYEKLGGKSPLNYYTDRLIEKLQKRLPNVYVTKAMRYTPPFAKEAIKELMYHNVHEVFLIPLYPHYSTTTTKSSLEDFYNTAKGLGFHARFHDITKFYENRVYNQAIIDKIEEALDGEDANEYELIFSAHSLPQKIIEKGDPYLQEVQEHVKILSSMLGNRFSDYHLAFQSKLGPVKWLEPGLDEKLKEMKGKKVLVYPISFTLDNSETEFELHIEYKEIAKVLGIKEYRVAQCVNDSDLFVEALVDIYQRM